MEGKRGSLKIMVCESGLHFAKKVVQELNSFSNNGEVSLVKSEEVHFANSEIKTVIKESLRGADIFIIQDVENSTNPYSVDENIRALKTAIDAAKRSDSHYITAVILTFPYARQDKSDEREALTAAQIAREIEDSGADRVITLDIHNTAIAGFFRKATLEDLHASKNIIDYIKTHLDTSNLIVISPDAGGVKRANYYAQKLGTKFAIVYKERDYSKQSVVENTTLLGDVKEKDVLIIDDMIATGGTMVKVSQMLREKHQAKDVYLACSLPLFNGNAIELLDNFYKKGIIKGVIGTDAVFHGEDFSKKYPWFKEVSVARYVAKVIFNINNYKSISSLLTE